MNICENIFSIKNRAKFKKNDRKKMSERIFLLETSFLASEFF